MTGEEVKQWIADLRSGDYRQTSGFYKYQDSYCCLGVLGESVMKIDLLPMHPSIGRQICNNVADTFGKHFVGQLIENNDAGLPFDKIADKIESKYAEIIS